MRHGLRWWVRLHNLRVIQVADVWEGLALACHVSHAPAPCEKEELANVSGRSTKTRANRQGGGTSDARLRFSVYLSQKGFVLRMDGTPIND